MPGKGEVLDGGLLHTTKKRTENKTKNMCCTKRMALCPCIFMSCQPHSVTLGQTLLYVNTHWKHFHKCQTTLWCCNSHHTLWWYCTWWRKNNPYKLRCRFQRALGWCLHPCLPTQHPLVLKRFLNWLWMYSFRRNWFKLPAGIFHMQSAVNIRSKRKKKKDTLCQQPFQNEYMCVHVRDREVLLSVVCSSYQSLLFSLTTFANSYFICSVSSYTYWQQHTFS